MDIHGFVDLLAPSVRPLGALDGGCIGRAQARKFDDTASYEFGYTSQGLSAISRKFRGKQFGWYCKKSISRSWITLSIDNRKNPNTSQWMRIIIIIFSNNPLYHAFQAGHGLRTLF